MAEVKERDKAPRKFLDCKIVTANAELPGLGCSKRLCGPGYCVVRSASCVVRSASSVPLMAADREKEKEKHSFNAREMGSGTNEGDDNWWR